MIRALAPLAALMLFVAALAGLSGCGGEPEDVAAAPAFKQVLARRGPFRIAVTANGLVRPIDRIELKSKAAGEVVELPIEVGDAVAEGALIAKLDQVDEKAELLQGRANLGVARAELALAEKRFERRRQLFTSDVISEEIQDETELELAAARGQLVQATTALERAEERMEDTVIVAPVTGVVLQKYVERGQIIASGVSNVGGGTPIADVADMRRVYIEAGIDEIDIGRIAVGQAATVRAEAFADRLYTGSVVRIAPEARVEQNVTLFDVVIEVENTDGDLKSGMNAAVEIVLVDEPDTLTIPVAALQNGDAAADTAGRSTVLVKVDDTYTPREIRTGRTDYRVIEVLAGLEGGEVLGIPMASRLKEQHDLLQERIRRSRTFGGSDDDKKKDEKKRERQDEKPAAKPRPAGGS
jgi:HlyD family secretion protein